ncbi:hypothetical protein [Glaciecola sp. SC05]|uniref:hypothetical protein n=1 Tax=Glaciecola sp. SC05 TaxID=1987355 RepID=UPI0035276C65
MNPQLLQHLQQNPFFNVVVLSGAGISYESGISTVRYSNRLLENQSVNDIAMDRLVSLCLNL